MSRRRASCADDGGWVLLTSIVMLSLMVTMAVTLLSIVDVQTGESGKQRLRETAFNLAEAGLNAQIFSLARDWPGLGDALTPYPTCDQTSNSPRCPSAAQLTNLIPTQDVNGATWQTVVRDNGAAGGAGFYSDALILGQPGYDANGDGQVWVRATATAKGKTRTIVGLVRAEQQEEDIPHGALISGSLSISNNGNKIMIDGTAGGGLPTAVVRCTPALLELSPCLGHTLTGLLSTFLSGLSRQISPNLVSYGYAGGPAMSVAALARLKATAMANGTYYSSCPASLAGAMVYIDTAAQCSYTGNAVYDSDAAPGMVVMPTGSLYLGGTVELHGIFYGADQQNTTGTVLQTQGNARIFGGVLVDGQGAVVCGSSKLNIQLAPNAFRAVSSYGSAGVIQNTWREIRTAQ
jgi:hypothetical protein